LGYANITLKPGEGAFINTDTAFTHTFVGEVMQGLVTNAIPAGYSIQASQIPQQGGVTSVLNLNSLGAFDNLLKWNGSTYDVFTALPGGGWDPSEPVIKVAESFFLNTGGASSWTRTFSVNN